MLTVDCRDAEAIVHELAVYVSDQLAAIPAMQVHGFALSAVDDGALDSAVAVEAIREYLDSIGEARNFAVLARGDAVIVHSVSGRRIEKRATSAPGLFSCPHCGFVTRYEVEYNTHKRIHYL